MPNSLCQRRRTRQVHPAPGRTLGALLALFALVVGMAAPALGAASSYVQIEGTGSTWSKGIVDQWIADVDANGMKVVYTGSGSSTGRKDFSSFKTDFGITEIPFGADEKNPDSAGDREFAYLPIVAGGTAFTYQVKVGGKLVKNIRLSGDTIAKIFTNKITNWNDTAITKDNNGRKLPSIPIIPVVRSDGSGTTAQFTRWLDNQYSADWKAFNGGSGLTSYYPKKGKAVGQSGSDQVMNFIASSAGNGTIGYVEYSYAVNKHYPVIKVLNKGGYFVEPTQYNVAVALTKAKINTTKGSDQYLTQILDDVYTATDPRTYPLSSYSYMLLPIGKTDKRMTTKKRQTLADFMFYSLCEGQGKAGAYGYSPLPRNLVDAGFEQIKKLHTADAAVKVDGKDASKCNNPTFDKSNLSKNKLAEIAPDPAACDKDGAGPCGGDTGSAPTTVDEAEDSSSSSGASSSDSSAPGAADPAAAGGAGAVGAVGSGQVVASGGAAAVPIDLVSSRAGDTRMFGIVAVLELLAVTLIPGLAAVYMRRRDDDSSYGES